MMQKIVSTFSLFLLIYALISCTDVFYPDDVISNKKILVVQGIILEGELPSVRLTWATPYEEDYGIEYISDAIVWIIDDMNNKEALIDTAKGIYFPVNNEFKGIMGRTYTLHVEWPSGDVFESTPEKITAPPDLDSLYAMPVNKSFFVLNFHQQLVEKKERGLEVMADLSKKADAECYFRFKTDVITEVYYVWNQGYTSVSTYEWHSSILDNKYDVECSFQLDSLQVVCGHNAGFLSTKYTLIPYDMHTSTPVIEGWILSMHVYSISENVYNYYNSIAQQLNADNNYFAPVPPQIKTNIRCVNGSDEKVTGVFEAASENIFYNGFAWDNDEACISKYFDYWPPGLGNGIAIESPPDFWVDF